jgi:hypothetical protein
MQLLFRHPLGPRHDGAMRARSAELGNDVGIEQKHRFTRRSAEDGASNDAGGHQVLEPRAFAQQELLQRRTSGALQPTPLLDRHEHGGLDAALGHDLRPLLAGLEELTEAGLRFLHLPASHLVKLQLSI